MGEDEEYCARRDVTEINHVQAAEAIGQSIRMIIPEVRQSEGDIGIRVAASLDRAAIVQEGTDVATGHARPQLFGRAGQSRIR